jgi:23S rRNA pseudouridine1911/1915/1917 synthase
MDLPPLDVLYEDNHLLAVVKPAGLATMGTPGGTPSLIEVAREYVRLKYAKPGNVYLGVMSRLDAPVTGVVLLARTSKAASRLTEQFRSHAVQKVYWAMVDGRIRPPAAECVDWIRHDDRHRRVRIAQPGQPGAKEARLGYRTLKTVRGDSLLEVEPVTGRKHQIRIQLARRGHPILGDRKYGSRRRWPSGIALHAKRLVVAHPVSGEPIALEAPLPPSWQGVAGPG